MASVTVRQFAEVLKVPVERLLGQLREAGLAHKEGEDRISEEEKVQLLDHLRGRRGKPASTEEPAAHPITLKRKTVSEISVSAEKKARGTFAPPTRKTVTGGPHQACPRPVDGVAHHREPRARPE